MIDLKIENVLKTRDELVAEKLREAILRGLFKPGERIDENKLAEVLKVSRTPVRSALRVLAAEGMVTIYPHRGSIVNGLSLDEFEEIYFIRGILEGKAAYLAAKSMDEDRIRNLKEILALMQESEDPDTWLELNAKFHHTIYQAANRPRMLSIISNIRNLATPFIRKYINNKTHMDNALVEHLRILNACKKGEGHMAKKEVEKHLQTVLKTVLQHIDGLSNKKGRTNGLKVKHAIH